MDRKTALSGKKNWAIFLTLVAFCVALRGVFPERGITERSPLALLDSLFALGLLVLIMLLGLALGQKILCRLYLERLSGIEQALFSIPLGLGVLAFGTLFLGLAGLFRKEALLLLLVLAGLVAWKELGQVLAETAVAIKRAPLAWYKLPLFEKTLVVLLGMVFALSLLQALTPPWDYDGLMYHLQGPRLFFQAGRIYSEPANLWTYYPFSIEMLFSLGMALGSDRFAKLLHLAFAVLLTLATWILAKRFVGRQASWLSAAILVGIPIFPLWASFAYNDIPWALAEFLALYAAMLWLVERRSPRQDLSFLVLAGIMMGLALGIKTMALGSGLVLGMWILWHSRDQGLRTALRQVAWFGGVAILVGSPWYLKNLSWTGNPVYPLFWASDPEVSSRMGLWMAYMQGFGVGRSLVDYLLLPVHVFTRYYRFGTFMGTIEIPGFLFLLILFYPWTRKTTYTNALLGWVVLRFIAWAPGVQQIRYLLPLFPALSVLSCHVLLDLAGRLRRAATGRILVQGLVLGMVAAALAYSLIFFATQRPWSVIVGSESKDAFLSRVLPLYPLTRWVETQLPANARVFLLWDGRGYYCDERCIPDVTQSRWPQIVSETWDINAVAARLHRLGASHILYSAEDMSFISQYDLSGIHRRSADFLLQQFIPACTREVYRDEKYSLLQLTCH